MPRIFRSYESIKSVKQLDDYIRKAADERQDLQDKVKAIDKEISSILSLIVLQSMFLYLLFSNKKGG
jgi:relaxase/mobilization nuclease family protein